MLKYAREDTHYLLKIYDRIMEDLEKRVNSTRLIDIVKKKSNQITQLNKQEKVNKFLYDSIESITVCGGAALDASIYKKYLLGYESKNLKSDISNDLTIFIAAHVNNNNAIDVYEFFEDKHIRDQS